MLQSIREKTSGWIATIILGLIILTMAFFGIESYLTPKVETYAARIEGPAKFLGLFKPTVDVTSEEFRKRFEQVRQQQRQAQGEAFNAGEFEKVENKRLVLDELIDEALLKMVAKRDGLVVPRSAVQKSIMGVEAFQANGKFDANQYQLALQMQGYTPQQFQDMVESDIAQRLLPSQLAASAYSSGAELDSYLRLAQQTRDVQFLDLPPPSMADAPPTEAQLKAWYDSHAVQYRSEEKVAVEYVELDATTLPMNIGVDEQSLRVKYEQEKSRFGTEEQRVASHILVQVPDKAPAAVADAALAKARDIATKAALPGADFAALARQYSDDAGSKDAGGDLGPVSKGVFGDAFDKAFFALTKGQVSAPVRLPDGWHIILFRDSTPGSLKTFDDVRAQLESEALESEREKAFNDIQSKLVDAVYADPQQLLSSAKKLGLTVNRTAPFTIASGEGIAALEPVRKAAFSGPQKTERMVSDPVEIGPNHVVVLHVIDVQPVAAIPMAQAHDRVLADFNNDRLTKAAKAQADAMLARAKKGESLETLATGVSRTVANVPGITRQAQNPQLAPLVNAAFRLAAPAGGKNDVGIAKLAPDHYALVAVTAVTDGDPAKVDAATRKTMLEQIAKLHGEVEARAYAEALRKGFKIEVAEDRL